MVEAGSAIAALAFLAGGIPIGLALWRRPPAERRRAILPLLIPAIVGAAGVAIIVVAVRTSMPRQAFVRLFLPYVVLLHLTLLASSIALSFALARSGIGQRLYRFALIPATVATLAMAAMLGATVLWGVAAAAGAPHIYNSSAGYLGLSVSYAHLLLAIAATMAVATGMAAASLLRGALKPEELPGGDAS